MHQKSGLFTRSLQSSKMHFREKLQPRRWNFAARHGSDLNDGG
jgi:hypothetical protein